MLLTHRSGLSQDAPVVSCENPGCLGHLAHANTRSESCSIRRAPILTRTTRMKVEVTTPWAQPGPIGRLPTGHWCLGADHREQLEILESKTCREKSVAILRARNAKISGE